MREDSRSHKCDLIWARYKILLKEKMRRTGVKNHGICNDAIRYADQNVLEHSALVACLCGMIQSTFGELKDAFSDGYMLTMMLHDVTETEMGDFADDGSAEQVSYKDDREYEFLEEFMSPFEPEEKKRYLEVFAGFQRKDNILYLIDKLEWIWFCGALTPGGDAGSLRFKESNYGLTDQDKHAISVTHSWRTVDAMVVHIIEHSDGIVGCDIIFELIRAMYRDIDGRIPEFFKE